MDEHNVGEMLSLLVGGRWTAADGHIGDAKDRRDGSKPASATSHKKKG
jgi:hypothetical protein